MTNRAYFDINADGEDAGFDATSGQALSVTLRDANGVRAWTLQTYHAAGYDPVLGILANPPRSSTGAPELTLVGATSGQTVNAATPSTPITTTAPSTVEAHSYIVRSLIDGGKDDAGRWDSSKIWERMISVNTINGIRKIVATERFQYSEASWEEPVNKAIELFRTTLTNQQVVNLATTAALAANTRTGNDIDADANGALANIDSVAPQVGWRILLKNEAIAANNGIWVVVSLGSAGTKWKLTRAPDADVSAEFATGKIFPIGAGSTLQATRWVMSIPSPFVLNTDAVSFFQWQSSGFYDVKQFGAIGNGSANDTAALTTTRDSIVAAGGGVMYFPRGTYLTDAFTLTNATGVTLKGDGESTSIIKARQTGAIVTFSGCIACGFEGLAIERKDSLFQSAGGHSLVFTNCVNCWTDNIRISYGSAGVRVHRSLGTHLRGKTTVDHLSSGGGASALQFVGESGVALSVGLTVDWLKYEHFYNGGVHVFRSNWAISTVYAVGDLVFANDKWWECTAGGTSAGSGTGPSATPGTDGPSAYTTGVTDNGVTWRFLIGNSFIVSQDFGAHNLEIERFDCLGPCTLPYQMWRSTGTDTPSGFRLKGGRIEQPISQGITLDRGSRVFVKPDILRVWGGRGISVNSTFGGGVQIEGGRIEDSQTNGITCDSGGVIVNGTEVRGSSAGTSGVHAGILVQAVSGVRLIGVQSTGATQTYGVVIAAGANDYTIEGGDFEGNGTGAISDGSRMTATNADVANNRGALSEFKARTLPSGSVGESRTYREQAPISTTNATVTTALSLTIPTGSVVAISARVRALSSIGDSAVYHIRAGAVNTSGTTVVFSSPDKLQWEDVAGWDATVDASGADLRLRVTGAASTNIEWGVFWEVEITTP